MADENDVAAFVRVALHLHVYLGHQGTGGIKHGEPAPLRRIDDRARDAVGGEDDVRAFGHLIDLLHEDGAEPAQPLDDVTVVHDLVADIDRSTKELDGALDDLDRPIDTGAEATGIGEQNLHQVVRAARRAGMRGPVSARRVFTAAAVGLSYGAASAVFHVIGPEVVGAAPGVQARVLAWTLAAAGCGVLKSAVNKVLVMTAVKGADPAASVREDRGKNAARRTRMAGHIPATAH